MTALSTLAGKDSVALLASGTAQTGSGATWSNDDSLVDAVGNSQLQCLAGPSPLQSKHLEATYGSLRATSAVGCRLTIDALTISSGGRYGDLEVAAVTGGSAGTFLALPRFNGQRVHVLGGVGSWFGAADIQAFKTNPVLAFRTNSDFTSFGIYRVRIYSVRVELVLPTGDRSRSRQRP